MTDKIYLDVEGAEAEGSSVVFEDRFPTYALPTNGSDRGEGNLVGAACGQVGLLNDGLLTSLAADELVEHVFFPGIPGNEFGPNSSAEIGIVSCDRPDMGRNCTLDQIYISGGYAGCGWIRGCWIIPQQFSSKRISFVVSSFSGGG